MRYIYIIIVLLAILVSCQERAEIKKTKSAHYAEFFTERKAEGYREVTIYNPWDSIEPLQHFILVNKDDDLPSDLPEGTIIRTPLNRVMVCASVHCSMLEILGIDSCIAAVCDGKYISLLSIQNRLKDGSVVDMGNEMMPNVEQILALSPELIFSSFVGNTPNERLEKTGIPVVKCVDYMESSPLGRAEWIRFLSFFFCKEQSGDSIFYRTEVSYNEVCEQIKEIKYRPTVFSDQKTGSVWYQPGGKSYMSQLFKDAGADFIWYEDKHTGSLPLSFESVYQAASEADYWLIKYYAPIDITYKTLSNDYELYEKFAAYKNCHIYSCNTAKVSYYEETPMHPDWLLKDMAAIFHPELYPKHVFKYYKPMK